MRSPFQTVNERSDVASVHWGLHKSWAWFDLVVHLLTISAGQLNARALEQIFTRIDFHVYCIQLYHSIVLCGSA
jgi:hypothetical protein